MRNPTGLSAALFTIVLCGCGGNKEAAPSASAEPVAPSGAIAKVEAPKPVETAKLPPSAAPSSIEEPGFSLKLAEAGPYKAGELSRFVLHLEPRGVFHINQEYPIEIALTGDAETSFPKASLARADAAQFDDKKARFDVPFTAKAVGDHKLVANVKFAVCTAENCVPDERDLALAVAVK
jgi:hypothetical protein